MRFTPLVCCECKCERRGNILGEAIGELKLSPRDLRRHRSRLMTWVREQYAVWGPQKTVFVRKDSCCKSADNTGESEGDNEERSVVLCRESGRWINSRRADITKEILPFFQSALLHCCTVQSRKINCFPILKRMKWFYWHMGRGGNEKVMSDYTILHHLKVKYPFKYCPGKTKSRVKMLYSRKFAG